MSGPHPSTFAQLMKNQNPRPYPSGGPPTCYLYTEAKNLQIHFTLLVLNGLDCSTQGTLNTWLLIPCPFSAVP